MMRETVAALKAFGPLFEENGLFGYIEPLGFEECSLRSKTVAMRAIQESGFSNFRIVYDTFHHHLGPDTRDTLENEYDVAYTGLVHVSGVEHDIPISEYRDDHRVLITGRDKLKNLQQIEQLMALGYTGDISFEPFASAVQLMETEVLKTHIDESIRYLTHT
jgi:2-keto-myo-inositol isomerase